MSPWLAVLGTLSFIIIVHEWGHFIVARRIGVKVERFSIGFGPKLFGFTRGETEYVICLFPFGGYVKMAGEAEEEGPVKPWEYRARPIWQRMAIVLAGPAVNYVTGFLLFAFIFVVGAPILSAKIGVVLKDYPAAVAGLREGDRVLSVNGKPTQSWDEVTKEIHSQTQSVTLVVQREGRTLTCVLQPQVKEVANLLGVKMKIGMVGIAPSDEAFTRRYPIHQAVAMAGERVVTLTVMTVQALWRIATGGMSVKESMTGPVGIFVLTSTVAQQGIMHLLQLIAVLSTSLGFFNLLPVPVLDGGHCLFLAIEKLKGSPVSLRIQEMMVRMGLGLLLLLLVVVTYNDVIRFGIVDKLFPFLHSN